MPRLQLGAPARPPNHAKVEQHGRRRGTAKCFQVLRMPAASATMDMKPMWETSTASSTRQRQKPRGLAHAAGHGPHQRRRPQHTQRASQQQRPGRNGGHRSDQPVRGLLAFLVLVVASTGTKAWLAQMHPRQTGGGTGWECGKRRPFMALAPKHRPSATPHQARDAGGQGQQGYGGGGGFEQRHRRSVFAARGPDWAGLGLFALT